MHPEHNLHEAQSGKNLDAMQETQVQALGQEDYLGKEMATHSSIPPAYRIRRTEKPEVTKGRTQLRDWTTGVPQPSQDGLPLGPPLPGPSVWRFLHYTLQAPGLHSQQTPLLVLYCDQGAPQPPSPWWPIHPRGPASMLSPEPSSSEGALSSFPRCQTLSCTLLLLKYSWFTMLIDFCGTAVIQLCLCIFFLTMVYPDVRTGPYRRLSSKELMLSNCAGEDSWESLGEQGGQTSKF